MRAPTVPRTLLANARITGKVTTLVAPRPTAQASNPRPRGSVLVPSGKSCPNRPIACHLARASRLVVMLQSLGWTVRNVAPHNSARTRITRGGEEGKYGNERRRSLGPAGNSHPEAPAPRVEAPLRQVRRVRHGVRGEGARGKAATRIWRPKRTTPRTRLEFTQRRRNVAALRGPAPRRLRHPSPAVPRTGERLISDAVGAAGRTPLSGARASAAPTQ
jgi:hypothetical protein